MRLAVIGSRRRSDKNSVSSFIESIKSSNPTIISGGCKGVDTWAVDAAKASGLACLVFKPDLPIHAPEYIFTRAYYERNKAIINNCDEVHAFVAPDRKGGTEYVIKEALRKNIPVIIH